MRKPKLPVLDDKDKALIKKTAQEGGLVQSHAETKTMEKPKASTTAPKKPTATAEEAAESSTPTKLTNKDLRFYLKQDGALAQTLAKELAKLDPLTRKYAVPTTILRDFINEHDEHLAELFLKNNPFR